MEDEKKSFYEESLVLGITNRNPVAILPNNEPPVNTDVTIDEDIIICDNQYSTCNRVIPQLLDDLEGYLKSQEEKLSNIQPETFEQYVDILHSVLGSMKFHRGRFAFGKDSIEIYNEREKKWEQLRGIGNTIFYSWFNDVISVACDLNKNIKRFVLEARRLFASEKSEEHKKQVELLEKLPKSISSRIKHDLLRKLEVSL